MKETTLTFTKNETGIISMALDALFLAERKEEHSEKFWDVFEEVKYKIIEARGRFNQ